MYHCSSSLDSCLLPCPTPLLTPTSPSPPLLPPLPPPPPPPLCPTLPRPSPPLPIPLQYPAVCLAGNVIWYSPEFLLRNFPFLNNPKVLEKKAVSAVASVRSKYLSQMTESLRTTAQLYHMRVVQWMVEMESAMRGKLKDDITRHSKLFVQVSWCTVQLTCTFCMCACCLCWQGLCVQYISAISHLCTCTCMYVTKCLPSLCNCVLCVCVCVHVCMLCVCVCMCACCLSVCVCVLGVGPRACGQHAACGGDDPQHAGQGEPFHDQDIGSGTLQDDGAHEGMYVCMCVRTSSICLHGSCYI